MTDDELDADLGQCLGYARQVLAVMQLVGIPGHQAGRVLMLALIRVCPDEATLDEVAARLPGLGRAMMEAAREMEQEEKTNGSS